MATLFQISNLLVMPFWLLMIVLPHWGWTKRIMASLWTVVPAALLYVILVAPRLLVLLGDLANPSLTNIAALLGTPEGATIAWIHFLAFDLFVGRWAYLDSRQHGFTAWLVSPILFVILMFGPLGLLLYLGARAYDYAAPKVSRSNLLVTFVDREPKVTGDTSIARRKTMTTATSSLQVTLNSAPINLVRSGLTRLWSFNKLMTLSVLLYLVLIPIYLVAAIVDPRLVTNAPAFIKPLKFVLSSAIYMATFLWLLTLVQGHKRWVQFAANFTAFAFLVENLIITVQAIRGVPSHFNAQTPLDAALFSTMGILITIVAFLNLLLGIWLLFQRLPDPVIAWSIRLGVFISFVGMIVAFLMTTGPTPKQLAKMEAGQMPTAIGAHSVGIEDGGPGLPFVGWSTVGGDLRVAHFIGLHGMQILPLLGLALSRRRDLSQRQRLMLIISAGIAYSGWLLLLTWQALRGQSIVAPDALTLSAYAGLGGFLLLMALVTFTVIRRPTLTPLTPVRVE